jgi:uncharacterized integral membrane protein
MLSFSIIAALIIAILAIVFTLQNADIILVTFLVWKFEGSLALVLLLAFATGVIASLLILLPKAMKKGQKKRIEELNRDI